MRRRATAVAAAIAIGAHAALAQDATSQRDSTERNTVAAEMAYTTFEGRIEAWTLTAVSLAHRDRRGSIIVRGNFAERFGTTGSQVEADAYPRVGDGKYFYLNAGWSGSSIFPGQRFGAEFYSSLPDAYEASAGVRVLWFNGGPVTLFTGTVGKYAGNYWLSLRPYVRFKDGGTSASLGLSGRRYTVDADNYLGARVSAGSTPSDQATPDAVSRTSSASAAVEGSWTIGGWGIGRWTAGYDTEELAPGNRRTGWTLSAGLAWRY